MNKPVAWIDPKELDMAVSTTVTKNKQFDSDIPLYTHPVKELTDEDIAKVVHELKQKASTPDRWVTAMQIGAETIIQLRDELRKAQEK